MLTSLNIVLIGANLEKKLPTNGSYPLTYKNIFHQM